MTRFESVVDSFPDPRELTYGQLVELIDELTGDEPGTEYLRGVAHRKVQILRAELTRRSDSAEDDSAA